jgi:hypothetical protein
VAVVAIVPFKWCGGSVAVAVAVVMVVTFCPSIIPLSMLTSIVSFLRTSPWLHPFSWHWYLRSTYVPDPPHLEHSTCTC